MQVVTTTGTWADIRTRDVQNIKQYWWALHSASLYCTYEGPFCTCLDRRARGTISQVTYFPHFKQLPLLLSTRTIDFNRWHTKTGGWTPHHAMDMYNSWRSMPRITYRWMSEPTHYPGAVNTDGQTSQTKQSCYLLHKKLIRQTRWSES